MTDTCSPVLRLQTPLVVAVMPYNQRVMDSESMTAFHGAPWEVLRVA
jgi:hypothetical protein